MRTALHESLPAYTSAESLQESLSPQPQSLMSLTQISISAIVKDSSLELSEWQRDKINSFFKIHEGKNVQMTLRKEGKPRSLSQNRYYHGVLVKMISEETGHDTEEIHEILKSKFLPHQFVKFGSEDIEVVKSTTRLSTEEFGDYIERIRAFAAMELNLSIPSPGES